MTPEMVAAITVGLFALIGAVVNAIIALRVKKVVDEVAEVGVQIKAQTNGMHTAAMERIDQLEGVIRKNLNGGAIPPA